MARPKELIDQLVHEDDYWTTDTLPELTARIGQARDFLAIYELILKTKLPSDEWKSALLANGLTEEKYDEVMANESWTGILRETAIASGKPHDITDCRSIFDYLSQEGVEADPAWPAARERALRRVTQAGHLQTDLIRSSLSTLGLDRTRLVVVSVASQMDDGRRRGAALEWLADVERTAEGEEVKPRHSYLPEFEGTPSLPKIPQPPRPSSESNAAPTPSPAFPDPRKLVFQLSPAYTLEEERGGIDPDDTSTWPVSEDIVKILDEIPTKDDLEGDISEFEKVLPDKEFETLNAMDSEFNLGSDLTLDGEGAITQHQDLLSSLDGTPSESLRQAAATYDEAISREFNELLKKGYARHDISWNWREEVFSRGRDWLHHPLRDVELYEADPTDPDHWPEDIRVEYENEEDQEAVLETYLARAKEAVAELEKQGIFQDQHWASVQNLIDSNPELYSSLRGESRETLLEWLLQNGGTADQFENANRFDLVEGIMATMHDSAMEPEEVRKSLGLASPKVRPASRSMVAPPPPIAPSNGSQYGAGSPNDSDLPFPETPRPYGGPSL